MFYRLTERLGRFYFRQRTRAVHATPPISLTEAGPLVLTQLQHKDLGLYLVAIKSFASQVLPGAVVILDDGSLTPKDHALLTRHIPKAQILPIARFRHPSCPQGGTWERLLAIARFAQDRYLIQLDADTLTLGPLPEVRQAIASDTAFVLGTWDRQTIEPMRAHAERVSGRHPNAASLHVQLAAEAAFRHLPEVDRLKYVRGCSGFCGFPAGSVELGFIVRFSQAMAQLLGARWHEWGSEQVTSNVVVANAPKAMVLPHPEYSDCLKMTETTRFIHFIGSCRFRGGRYASTARQVLADLRRTDAA